jgi:cell wall hydrolase
MWPVLIKMLGGGVATVVDSAGGLVKTIWGDRAAKDAALAAARAAEGAALAGEQHDVLGEFAAEFVARQQRTWWDSFADGINRMPRPMMALGIQAMFIWAAFDPVTFVECMRALQTVPEPLWIVWGGIASFFFGGRILERLPQGWKVEPRALDLAKEIVSERAGRREAAAAARAAAAAAPPPIALSVDNVTIAAAAPPAPPPVPPPAPPCPPASTLDPSVPHEAWAEQPELQAATDNAGSDRRAMAATIWGEARGEPLNGKIAVACVIRNRAANPGWWGKGVAGVCTAKWQFSCWFDGQAPRVRTVDESDRRFIECLHIADDVLGGEIDDPTGGADHYYADTIDAPHWARDCVPTTVIGRHRFFKLGLSGRG